MKNLKTPLKKCLLLVAVPGAIMLFLSSCIKDHNNYTPPPVAGMAFVQASTDEPPINFLLNSDLVNNWGPIKYGDHFGYFNAYAGHRTANFNNAFTGGQLLSDTMTLHQNVYYTLFLANTAAKPQTLLLTDTLRQPTSGNATVRFVNVSAGTGAVDLQIKGTTTTTIANKFFTGYSGFVTVPGGGTDNLVVTTAGTSTVLVSLNNVNFVKGGVYTVWLYGLKTTTTSGDDLAIGVMTNALY